jgi:putative dehydrogenase
MVCYWFDSCIDGEGFVLGMRVAIVGAGEMGAALGRRLVDNGAEVFTLLEGRSAASAARARAAGMKDAGFACIGACDLILSVLSSEDATDFAATIAAALAGTRCKAVYVDCNVVSSRRLENIAAVVAACGAVVVDACIIGRPPTASSPGPRIYVSGHRRFDVLRLREFGLDIRDLGERFGAASSLKRAHSGVSKGLIALAAFAFAAADADGVGDELRAILLERPVSSKTLISDPPEMPAERLDRWSSEMSELADSATTAAATVFDALAESFVCLAELERERQAPPR